MLILSGDQLYRMDFRKIIAQHIATGADVTIAALPVSASKVESLGVMRVDDNLEIKQFAEKPKDPAVVDSLAMSPALEARLTTPATEKTLPRLHGHLRVQPRRARRTALDNTMTDFGKEVIPSLLGRKRLFAYIFEGYWEDIGTVRDVFRSQPRAGAAAAAVQFLHAHDAHVHPCAFPARHQDQPLHDRPRRWSATDRSSPTPR